MGACRLGQGLTWRFWRFHSQKQLPAWPVDWSLALLSLCNGAPESGRPASSPGSSSVRLVRLSCTPPAESTFSKQPLILVNPPSADPLSRGTKYTKLCQGGQENFCDYWHTVVNDCRVLSLVKAFRVQMAGGIWELRMLPMPSTRLADFLQRGLGLPFSTESQRYQR